MNTVRAAHVDRAVGEAGLQASDSAGQHTAKPSHIKAGTVDAVDSGS